MNDDKKGISTEGGAYVEGQVHTDGGDFVGRDKIIYETHYHYVDHPGSDIPYLAPSLPPHHVPREAELAELRTLLLGDEHQVAVTALRGMGGVGKTTLAIALCHDKRVIDAFPDGVLWATLGPQADILSAQAAWGEVLGHDLSNLPDAEARAGRLRSLLHNKHCLLVLDDVWDTAHLPPLQVGGPGCTTLVTTRERKVAQKVGMAQDLDVLEPEQAITLLERWAGEISEDEKAVAGELASRLGYLPLALALAGAQVQDGETWDDLLAAFHDAQGADVTLLDLDDPEMRDESLALTFRLSLERLGDALPEHFVMLGVFAAGREAPFTVEAAAAVWEMKPIEAKKILGRLVRAALLNKEGENYSLHLLLCDYARSRLDEATRQAAEARHSAYYLAVAQRSSREWQIAEVALPQLRMAWSQVSRDDADSLFAWARASSAFFKKRGRWADAVAWDEAALAVTIAHGQREREAWCRRALGEVYLVGFNNLVEAMEQCQASLAFAREIEDLAGEASALNGIGRIQCELGRWDEALESHQAALAIARKLEHLAMEAWELNNIGVIYHKCDELAKALEYYQASLEKMREFGDRRGEAKLLNHIGFIHERNGELTRALECYQLSLSLQPEVGDQADEARSHSGVGHISAQRGELAEALEHYQASLAIYRQMGVRLEEARLLHDIARLYHQRQEFETALSHFKTSLIIKRQMGDRAGEAYSLWSMGLTYAEMGCLADAEAHLNDALVLFEALNVPEAAKVLKDLKRVRNQLGAGGR